MKRLISLLLAATMAVSLCACGSSADNGGSAPAAAEPAAEAPAAETPAPTGDAEYMLIVNMNKPEPAAKSEKAWMEAVTEKSGGRIQFEPYYSSSLLSPSEVPQGLKDGIVDIAITASAEWPNLIPTSAYVLNMPFSGVNATKYYEILPSLMEEYPEIEQEYTNAGMKLIGFSFGAAGNLFTVAGSPEVHVPTDLKGKQIIATETTLQSLVSNVSGAPVSCGPADFYSYLERSVADGIFNHWGTFVNSAVFEVVDQVVVFGQNDDSTVSQPLNVIVMGQQCWDKLPADLQQVFTDCAQVMIDVQQDFNKNLMERGYTAIAENDITLVHLTDEEVAVWADAFAPIRDELLSSVDKANGTRTQEVYNKIQEMK